MTMTDPLNIDKLSLYSLRLEFIPTCSFAFHKSSLDRFLHFASRRLSN